MLCHPQADAYRAQGAFLADDHASVGKFRRGGKGELLRVADGVKLIGGQRGCHVGNWSVLRALNGIVERILKRHG